MQDVCQCITYSGAIFSFFCLSKATHCTDRGEIWRGGVDLHDKFNPIGAGWVTGPQNYKFYKILEYKRPAGVYFHAQFLRSFQAFWTDTSRINCLIFGHTPKEFQSYGSS